MERLAGKSDDGAFYLTQAMGGGKTHSLIAFGLLASDPGLRREVVPSIAAANEFTAAKVVIRLMVYRDGELSVDRRPVNGLSVTLTFYVPALPYTLARKVHANNVTF
jgi:predicted AAA+ superfamily ATPase